MPLGGSRGPGSASGGLWGACGCKFVKCPKSYYTEQFGALEGLEVPLGGSRGPGSASGGLWGACGCKFVKCPKSYYFGAI